MSIFSIAVLVFAWIYAINEFGFFLGLGLGWVPSLFIAWIFDIVLAFTLAGFATIFYSDPTRTKMRIAAKKRSQISDIENAVEKIVRHSTRIQQTEKESTERGVEYAMKFQERYAHFLGSFSDVDLKLIRRAEKILAQGITIPRDGSDITFLAHSESLRCMTSPLAGDQHLRKIFLDVLQSNDFQNVKRHLRYTSIIR